MENFNWPIIGILATIIVPWTVYLLRQERKELSYNFTAIPVLSSTSARRVEVVLEGAKLERVNLITFELVNSGRFNIKRRDFDRDMVINFEEKANVTELEIISTNPYTMHPEIINGGNCIIIKPIDLRAKNSFKIKSIVNNYSGYSLDFRFSGAGSIKKHIEIHSLSARDKAILVLYAIVAGLFSLTLYKFNADRVPGVYTIILSAMNINIMYFVYRILLKNK